MAINEDDLIQRLLAQRNNSARPQLSDGVAEFNAEQSSAAEQASEQARIDGLQRGAATIGGGAAAVGAGLAAHNLVGRFDPITAARRRAANTRNTGPMGTNPARVGQVLSPDRPQPTKGLGLRIAEAGRNFANRTLGTNFRPIGVGFNEGRFNPNAPAPEGSTTRGRIPGASSNVAAEAATSDARLNLRRELQKGARSTLTPLNEAINRVQGAEPPGKFYNPGNTPETRAQAERIAGQGRAARARMQEIFRQNGGKIPGRGSKLLSEWTSLQTTFDRSNRALQLIERNTLAPQPDLKFHEKIANDFEAKKDSINEKVNKRKAGTGGNTASAEAPKGGASQGAPKTPPAGGAGAGAGATAAESASVAPKQPGLLARSGSFLGRNALRLGRGLGSLGIQGALGYGAYEGGSALGRAAIESDAGQEALRAGLDAVSPNTVEEAAAAGETPETQATLRSALAKARRDFELRQQAEAAGLTGDEAQALVDEAAAVDAASTGGNKELDPLAQQNPAFQGLQQRTEDIIGPGQSAGPISFQTRGNGIRSAVAPGGRGSLDIDPAESPGLARRFSELEQQGLAFRSPPRIESAEDREVTQQRIADTRRQLEVNRGIIDAASNRRTKRRLERDLRRARTPAERAAAANALVQFDRNDALRDVASTNAQADVATAQATAGGKLGELYRKTADLLASEEGTSKLFSRANAGDPTARQQATLAFDRTIMEKLRNDKIPLINALGLQDRPIEESLERLASVDLSVRDLIDRDPRMFLPDEIQLRKGAGARGIFELDANESAILGDLVNRQGDSPGARSNVQNLWNNYIQQTSSLSNDEIKRRLAKLEQ